jgi:chaperone required for assembly of F1-ATPase
MERAVYSTKSFIIALALIRRKLNTEEAALASHVEVTSQIKTWGEVEDSKLSLSFLTHSLIARTNVYVFST